MDSNSNKEQEQLLQDASTLLMFANVAAKQQQQQQQQQQQKLASPPQSIINNSNNISNNNISNVVEQIQTSPLMPAQIISGRSISNSMTINQIPPIQPIQPIQPVQQVQSTHPIQPIQSIQSIPLVGPTPQTQQVALQPIQTQAQIQPVTTQRSSVPLQPLKDDMLPTKGNFIRSHKRSSSTPENFQNENLFKHHHSPGPANVALARGINLKTGKRNSNNAMIAAAALAAAADIPLPLKPIEKPEETKKDIKPNEDELTEPEDDDKTDDELPKKSIEIDLPNSPNQTDTDKSELSKQNELNHNVPDLASYQVDPDSGIIGCICDIDDDDGFTIQCDVCYRWQHCLCMDFKTNEEVPEDEYKCYYCDELKWGKFDPEFCRKNTLERLALDKSLNESKVNANNTKRKHSISEKLEKSEKKKKLDDHNNNSSSNNNINNNNNNNVNININNNNNNNNNNSHTTENTSLGLLPNKNNELLDDGISAESYQSLYYKLKLNDYKNETTKRYFEDLGKEFYNSYLNLSKSNQQNSNIKIMSLNQFNSLKLSRIILPNQMEYLQKCKGFKKETNQFNKSTVQVKPNGDNQKQKFNGISKLGLFISADNLSANNEVVIPEYTPIIEYLGEIDLFEHYISDSINQYAIWGTTKPNVLKTTLDMRNDVIDLVIDSRFVGNESRFIRKSCPITSNCKIETIYIPDINSFKFLIVTSRPIKLNSDDLIDEELRLDWEWDVNHPILKLYNDDSLKFDQLSDFDKSLLISNIDKISHFIECGCSTSSSNSNCSIYKIKKATSYLLRSTKKISSISNVNLTRSKEELIIPKKTKEYIAWKERSIERDKIIQMKLLVTTNEDEEGENTKKESTDNDLSNTDNSVNKTDKTFLFKIPYKKQLIAKGKEFINNLKESSINKKLTITANKELPVPVIPELVIKIENSINEKINSNEEDLKELNKESIEIKINSGDNTTASNKEDTMNNDDNLKEVKINKQSKANDIVPPPAPVKKLSFADYKKKMK